MFGSLLTASVLTFGVMSCNSGNERGIVEDEQVAADEIGYEPGLSENEVANTEVAPFREWDINNDQLIDKEEFRTVANNSGFYNEWDRDGDGLLTEGELNKGVYGIYDQDRDNVYSEDEYNAWNTAWGGEYDNFNEWDVNNDNSLDADEFNAGVEEAEVYRAWDVDNDRLYTPDEVNEGLYSTWDNNADANLADDEFENMEYNLWGF